MFTHSSQWAEHLLGHVPPYVSQLSNQKDYDFHFVQDPEVPYEEDEWRFIPNKEERLKFHEKLLDYMQQRGWRYEILSGDLQSRKDRAIQIVNELLEHKNSEE